MTPLLVLRLRYRSANGSAIYLAVTAEGSELLTIHADGSRSSHMIKGVCADCAFGTQCTSHGLQLLTVVPDTVLLELIAYGTALNGGTVMHRPRRSIGPRPPSLRYLPRL
jgi:hypothetical protein